ncbi:hypothetical protein SASPL_125542 [Salvia splendens]|uniref:Uncharacterized protein n=1 Tax=Salvia splendens TaxID=180675 RepID=A0A8X8XIQ0_SALSN|nr:hypothetical protein SASPL_125542 [Salvia splendens]
MNAWAAVSRGEASRITRPSFAVFLRRKMLVSGIRIGITEEKLVTRRLVFEKEKVERIRKLEASRSEVKDPSRVEAVSAFLWRSFIEAHKQCAGGNGRHEDKDGYGDMVVSRLRAAIRVVDEDYVEAISDEEFVREVLNNIGDIFTKENCVFTSWLRFPFYEADFGWRKPARVCTAMMPYMNLVILRVEMVSKYGSMFVTTTSSASSKQIAIPSSFISYSI